LRPAESLALVLLSLIWGSSFLFTKVVVAEVPPFTLVAGRLLVPAVLLFGLLRVSGYRLAAGRTVWAAMIFMGVANNVIPFSLITWAQQHIDSSLAAILVSTLPLFTAIIAHFWIGEPLTRARTLGVLVGFAGAVTIVGADLRNLASADTLGELAVLAGSLGYAVSTTFARGFLRGQPPQFLAFGQMAMAAVFATPLALAVDQPLHLELGAKVALAWVALGVVNTGLAYLIFFWLVQRVTVVQISLVSYLIPVTATFLGWVVLGERLGASALAGFALVILGVLIVNRAGLRAVSDSRVVSEPTTRA